MAELIVPVLRYVLESSYLIAVALKYFSACANGVIEDVKISVGLKPIKTILGRPRL